MSTPVQYVPTDFQQTMNLPTGQPDQAAVAKANADLARSKAQSATAKTKLDVSSKRLASLKAQMGNTRLSAAQRHALALQYGRASSEVVLYTAQLKTSTASMTTAQSAVYTANGQFDKLLTGTNRDAYLGLQSLFNSFGLGSLAGKIYGYVQQGYGADTISLLLQDTSEYKKRFAANEDRVKTGLPVLTPAEYLSAESAYRQILSNSGLPTGFYDSPADFQRWIAGDVSPTEIKDRVDMAVDAVGRTDPTYRNALFQLYGIGEHDLAAYFLDRKTAEPILKKQAAAGAIGAAALRRGFGLNQIDLEGYASLGISAQDAENAYGQIANGFEAMLGIAGRYGSSWDQRQAEQEVFTPGAAPSLGSESASEKGKRLRSQERGMFSGGPGSSSQGLAAGYQQT